MSDKVREAAYDAWTRTVGVSNAPGGNLAMSPLDAWRAAWQASRAAALEEAAKLADEHREQSYGDSASYALEVLADELRTLAKEPADNARAGLGGE